MHWRTMTPEEIATRPETRLGGALLGMAWGLGLQGLMMFTYPRLLQVRLDDPGFLTMGIVGHAFWGLALGEGLKRWWNRMGAM